MTLFIAALSGALFGAGLLVSGMTQPARIVGFLDVTRGWDPSLAFVMAGAVTVYALAFWGAVRRRQVPLWAARFHLPTRRDVDAPLVVGAAVFGAGWGLGGLCPGPGLVAAAAGSQVGLVFVGAMIAGMLVQRLLRARGAFTAKPRSSGS